MSQNSLEQSDIDTLADLLLRSQQSRAREALCMKIGIDPHLLHFIRDSSDADFATQLIYHLDNVDDKEALCKLCCQELFTIFNKSTSYGSTLKKIAVKLNCNHDFGQNSSNNKTLEQLTSPQISEIPSLRINRKQSLLWVGLVAASLVTAVVGYEIFKSQKKYPSDKQIYTIVTAGDLDSDWRLSMEENSAALGTRAMTNWTQRVDKNSKFQLIYKPSNNAYEIHPKVKINNDDDCLTTFNDGLLKLDKCDDTAHQNFDIDCGKQDFNDNLSECFIVNKATGKPIGTHWHKDTLKKGIPVPNYESITHTPDKARWWSFVVQEASPR